VTVPGAAAVDEQEAEERARTEARLRLRRGRMITALVAATLVVIIAVVALLGGFRARTDLFTRVAAGSVVVTGPYEVTLVAATVQHRTSSAKWVVVASGTARTTGLTSIDPPTGTSGFLYARDADGGETQAASSITLGDSAAYATQETLTPGLPPVPWSVSFEFPASPGDTLLLAAFDQEYTTPYLFSDEEGWRPTHQASTMTLPLVQLADTTY
jgi:hypothetical protein